MDSIPNQLNPSQNITQFDYMAEREMNLKYAREAQKIDVAKFIITTLSKEHMAALAVHCSKTLSDPDLENYDKAMNFLISVLGNK